MLRSLRSLYPFAYRTQWYATHATAYGQPFHDSHPHLVAYGQITPGIPASDFERRRQKLMKNLPENSLVVSMAAPVKYMSGKIFYKYRQHSDYWYLTGVEEPESAVLIEKNSSPRGYNMTLFLRGKDEHSEKWEGGRTSLQDASKIFSADQVLPSSSFMNFLREAFPLHAHVFIDAPELLSSLVLPTQPLGRKANLLKYLPSKLSSRDDTGYILEVLASKKRKPLCLEVGKLRVIKSEHEQKVMQAAANISSKAHTKTMRFVHHGLLESALVAHFEYICALEGSQRLAFVPVVASGKNALTIHYTRNDDILRDGQLVLVDAGCEYNGYASDITRTYPISGTFSSAQATLYSAVLSVQKSLIALCDVNSSHSLASLHRKSVEFLRKELENAGIALSAKDLERSLYEHHVGHGIGIDLHESIHLDSGGQLAEGMVITVEPGLYIPPSPLFPKHYHNMGIRIEDQVLITKEGPVVLSANAPKEIVDIEGACQGLLGLEPY